MLNKRKITTIYVDEELKNRALSLGINLSGWFNTKLKEVVEILEGNSTREYELCGGGDLNSRIPTEPDPQSGTFDLARQPPLYGGRNSFDISLMEISCLSSLH